MFGLTFDKVFIIGVLAAFLIGPERLPFLAANLAQLIKRLKSMTSGVKDRIAEELGEDGKDVDWKKLDPRQYDPRRIIRDALDPRDPS